LSTQLSLLPETSEEKSARLDAAILHLLMGYVGGPLGLTLEDDEKQVLRTIRFMRGLSNAMNIREIQQRTGLDVRQIKKAVRTLRINFRLPIGSSKSGTGGGYYLILTDADSAAWAKDVLDQVRAELAVLHAVAGYHAGLELLGQLHLEAMKEMNGEVNL
jgi:hypothetical protein